MHPTSALLAAFTLMLSAVGLVYGLAAFTPTRVLNGRSGTPLHTHTDCVLGGSGSSLESRGERKRAPHEPRRASLLRESFIFS